ncbi:AI-2E family transporter [Flavihumibacter rivuli]|uniref:AI-2E family transporter n=1 Tax=Flavihumibacter rivuli TaxID=2838156 RepID=UPI001BDEB05D|nr:AI-2E family transporter [Flavihumibacter rivuli]ULQ55558.1 AI-2E family transporter [Flavihumibacter rivuli]
MEPHQTKKELGFIEKILALLLVLLILYMTYSVIGVFAGVFTFAIIFAVSFYGLFEKLAGTKGRRRKLIAFLYGLLLVSVIAVPMILLIDKMGDTVHKAQYWVTNVSPKTVEPLPDWVKNIPLAGRKIDLFWTEFSADPDAYIGNHRESIKAIFQKIISGGLGLLGTSLELVLGIIISAILLFRGSQVLKPIYAILEKLASPETAVELVDSAGKAIRGVAIGVMGTAFIEAILAWVGYSIAGIGAAPALAALTFLFAVVQLGPVLVLIPVVIWLGNTGQTGWMIFMIIYGLVVLMGVDNVLKPILIGKSGKMPILVLFLGVVGGMSLWGFTGMFKGAIVVALTYTLFKHWTEKPGTTKLVNEEGAAVS